MLRFLVIILLVFLMASSAHAEWTYKELARHPSSDMGTMDVYAEFTDSVTKEKRSMVFRLIKDGDAEKQMAKIAANIASEPAPEVQMNKSEVEAILKEKGFLQAAETLEQLKTLEELKTADVEVIK